MTPEHEPRYVRSLRARLKATGRKSRRLKLALANELFASEHPKHLAEVLGLMWEASQEEPLTFSEKCRLQRAQVRLRVRTEAPWMGPKRDREGFPYPRGAPAGTEVGANWDAI